MQQQISSASSVHWGWTVNALPTGTVMLENLPALVCIVHLCIYPA